MIYLLIIREYSRDTHSNIRYAEKERGRRAKDEESCSNSSSKFSIEKDGGGMKERNAMSRPSITA
jgi:hypothetical protein